MDFLKRRLPVLLCISSGLVFFLQFYVPHRLSQRMFEEANVWFLLLSAFALLLGLGSVLKVHLGRVLSVRAGWGYSAALLAALVGMATSGILCRAQGTDPQAGATTTLGWAYTWVLCPLNATMFSTLGFFVASAAFRTFRLRSLEAGLLMSAALVLVLGRIPLAEHLWARLWHLEGASGSLGEVTAWILDVPAMAAQRGILFGVALGAIATALKVILGLERPYLGGKE